VCERQGEIEHHGRIDTQVTIRGDRVRATRSESVLLRVRASRRRLGQPHARPPMPGGRGFAYYSPQAN